MEKLRLIGFCINEQIGFSEEKTIKLKHKFFKQFFNKMENVRQAALLTLNTIIGTILGHERAIFRVKYSPDKSEMFNDMNLNVLNLEIENLIKFSTAGYFNSVYDSLVSGDDPFVNDIFDKYKRFIDHSPICLIHILFNYCLTTHLALNRTLFVYNGNLEDYAASVKLQLEFLFNDGIIANVTSLFDHECKGERVVKPLPEGQKFFNFVSVQKDSPNKCSMCEKETETKCSRCKAKRYCSVECQRKDWKEHKKTCGKSI